MSGSATLYIVWLCFVAINSDPSVECNWFAEHGREDPISLFIAMILAGIVIGYSGAKDLKSGKFITYCKFKSVMRISRRARNMLPSIGTTALPSSLRVGLREDAVLESKVVAENVGNDVVDSDSDEDEEAQGSSNLRKRLRRGSSGDGISSCISSIATRICGALRVVYRTYSAPDVRSIVLFNLIMIFGSFYIAMSVTNWNGIARFDDEKKEDDKSDSARFSLTTTWILIVSQWSYVVLYFFTLDVFRGTSRSSSISDIGDSPVVAPVPAPLEMNDLMIGNADL